MNASERIDEQVAALSDWRGPTLARLRELILEAAPGVVEEWKWNSPTWSQNGLLVSVRAFKKHIGVNFFQGVSLEDPHGLFNSGLDAKNSRSVNIYEGDEVDESAFQALVRAAVHGTLIPEHARIGFGIWTMLPIRDVRSRSLDGQGMNARWRRFRVRGVDR